MSDEQKRMRLQHLHDQNWAALRGRFADIRRIANDGPTAGIDDDLVRMVFSTVAADLITSNLDSQSPEGD